jgi:hypothetical protein
MSVTLAPPVSAAFGVNAAFMLQERRELGIHVISDVGADHLSRPLRA